MPGQEPQHLGRLPMEPDETSPIETVAVDPIARVKAERRVHMRPHLMRLAVAVMGLYRCAARDMRHYEDDAAAFADEERAAREWTDANLAVDEAVHPWGEKEQLARHRLMERAAVGVEAISLIEEIASIETVEYSIAHRIGDLRTLRDRAVVFLDAYETMRAGWDEENAADQAALNAS